MRVLHHYQLSASSRFIRLLLAERGLVFLPKTEIPWERKEDFLRLNPAGDVPVLVTEDGLVLSGATVIAEYIEETEDSSQVNLLWGEAPARAEIRRMMTWFEGKFSREVGAPLLSERVIKRFSGQGTVSSVVIRAAMTNLQIHLDYIDWLAEQNSWLAGKQMSLADLAAAAHLSVLDFFGDIDWSRHAEAKLWFAKMKSRPSFRDLLGDQVVGMTPPPHYSDMDF
jgi:glutathione S-transferase